MRLTPYVFALILVNFVSQNAFAQKEETILGPHGLRLSGIWGGTKSQITRFGSTNSFMNGAFLGAEFGKALYVGYGNYSLNTDVRWDGISTQDFNYQWSGPIVGYSINSWKRVHPTVTMQAGQGNVWFREDQKDKILVIQPSVGVELNVFRWFHVGLDGGYRFTTDASTSGLTDSQLSGAFGQLSLRFGYSWNSWKSRFRKSKSSDSTRSEKM